MRYITIRIFFLLCLSPVVSRAELVISSLTPVHTKTQKHFDIDRDKFLSPYERLLLRTHEIMHYPLVKRKKQRPYDYNGDHMLEPFEEQHYLRDKGDGSLSDVYKNYLGNNRKLSKLRQTMLKK